MVANILKSNRPATLKELSVAHKTLLHLGEDYQASIVSHFIKEGKNNPIETMDPAYPTVVTDFSANVESNVILVPSGHYTLPPEFINYVRFIIGLENEESHYPHLHLQGTDEKETHHQTGEKKSISVFHPKGKFKLANVILDAPKETVMKLWLDELGQFENLLMNVKCTDKVDVLNLHHWNFLQNRPWAIDVYGLPKVLRLS